MRFHRECVEPGATYSYHGLVHRAGALFNEADFIGDENAIVDFKYSASPKITWWFDHHLSAFLTPADHEDYRRGMADGRYAMRRFYDPSYTSCAGFLTHIASTRFGFGKSAPTDLEAILSNPKDPLYNRARELQAIREAQLGGTHQGTGRADFGPTDPKAGYGY